MANDQSTAVEEWRAVVGLEGRYEVSSLGRVRSLRQRNKFIDRLRPIPLVLKPGTHSDGYKTVALSGRRSCGVHVLVLEAFVGPRHDGYEAGHLDGTKDNNRPENLAWVTRKENASHRRIHGTETCGEKHGHHKLTTEQVREIRAKYRAGRSKYSLAQEYGHGITAMRKVCEGKSWAHVV